MSASDIDTVAKQLAELQRQMEEERQRHAQEQERSNDTIRMLQDRLQESQQTKLQQQIKERAETEKRVAARNTTTTVKRTTTTTTTRSGSVGKTKVGGAASDAASDSPSQPSKSRFAGTASNGTPREQQQPARRPSTSPSNKTVGASPAPAAPSNGFTTTALQHAWDKFCVKARGEFTVKELSLLSCDTLKLLMEYYAFRDPVEVAQVEAQWALLQEGRDTAYQATPHDGPSKRRSRSFSPVLHPQEFNSDVSGPRKPHLSNRVSLAREGGAKVSNPNSACERHRSVSPGGKGNMHRDPAACGDPNNRTPERYRVKPTGKRSFPEYKQHSYEQKVYPRGKGRSYSPDPGNAGPYPLQGSPDPEKGRRKFNVEYSSEHQDRGVRIGYKHVPKDDPVRSKRAVPGGQRTNIISLA